MFLHRVPPTEPRGNTALQVWSTDTWGSSHCRLGIGSMGASNSNQYKIHQSPKWGKEAEQEVKAVRALLNAADTSGDGLLDLQEITVRAVSHGPPFIFPPLLVHAPLPPPTRTA